MNVLCVCAQSVEGVYRANSENLKCFIASTGLLHHFYQVRHTHIYISIYMHTYKAHTHIHTYIHNTHTSPCSCCCAIASARPLTHSTDPKAIFVIFMISVCSFCVIIGVPAALPVPPVWVVCEWGGQGAYPRAHRTGHHHTTQPRGQT